ncbi:rubrerythrin family protein [Halobacteriales archaeon QS_1_68_17]|nr:MAG: rubrerythrin family protein [Halobacteriales archaeon QS_1_68_17]
MDGETLRDRVQESKRTALDRLGSEKALLAVTDADLETGTVLATAARSAARDRDRFEAWAGTADHDDARAAFEAAAATRGDHYDRIVATLDGDPGDPDAADDPVTDYLRGLEGDAERVAAGLVGRSLASERTLLQVVNFFVNEADSGRADLFREIRADERELVDRGTATLDALPGDPEAALAAAEETVARAYEDYATTLESMGLDPKPVC